MERKTLVPSRLTAQDVLDILRDEHRHQCQYDPEADPDIDLTFDSTITDWRHACDLVGWRRLAKGLNTHWKTNIGIEQWKLVLVPPNKRKLRDVCQLLAENSTTEVVSVPTIHGRPCAPAGVYFAVRELLARQGADVSNLRPSTPLALYTRRYGDTIAGPISQLAPGALPPIEIKVKYSHWCLKWFIIFSLVSLSCLTIPVLFPFLWIILMILTVMTWLQIRKFEDVMAPVGITFGDLHSFRDLSVRLASHIRR